MKKTAALLFCSFGLMFLTGCLEPSPPDEATIRSSLKLGDIDIFQMQKHTVSVPNTKGYPAARPAIPRLNALFVIEDNLLTAQTQPLLSELYHTNQPPVFEEAAWWFYAPTLQKTYSSVLRIPRGSFTRDNLTRALNYLEAQKTPYDVFFLIHGFANHLFLSKGQGFLDWHDVDAKKGNLHYARSLYLQACQGNTLANDFLEAGFQSVFSFKDLTENFFFPQFLLQFMALEGGDMQKAYAKTLEYFAYDLAFDIGDRLIVDKFIRQPIEVYLKQVSMPVVSVR